MSVSRAAVDLLEEKRQMSNEATEIYSNYNIWRNLTDKNVRNTINVTYVCSYKKIFTLNSCLLYLELANSNAYIGCDL